MIVARTRRLGQTLIGNVDDPAVRLLVVLSNAVYIKDTMLPLLKVEFETFFQVSAAHVSKVRMFVCFFLWFMPTLFK